MATINKCNTYAFVFFTFVVSVGGISYFSMQDLKAAVCTPPSGLYNVNDLVTPKVWSLNYTANTSKCIDKNNQTIGCEFLFAFCHGYNCSATDPKLMNASVCLMVEAKNRSLSKMYKLGSYDPNVNPFEDVSDASSAKFVAHFAKGSPYTTSNNKSCQLQMDMTFTCNQNGLWKSQGQSKTVVNSTLLKNIQYDSILCKYNLSFDYNGACPVIPIVPSPTSAAGLSAGTILIIIFFVCLSVYCIFGSMLKCLQGYHGKEILPNTNFWVMLPVFIADGFIFTCEKCCFCRSASDARYDSI